MTAANHPFTIEQGATFKSELTFTDSNNAVVDLTGYAIRMQARIKASSPETVLNLSVGAGITITDAGGGLFEIEISATDTAALTGGQVLVYDLELETPTGHVTRLLEGKIMISPEVTR
ncbi:MAG: hypothetical protein OSB62_08915 [Alphaproteobacteria bacterium]|nr:hypothetical protein [Alphaproteobacteria bacterium]